MSMRSQFLLAGLEAIHATRLHRVAPRFMTGVGAILTFHHVRPARTDCFQPSRNLEITPHFLDRLLTGIQENGEEIVSLDEAHRRLTEGDFARRFVVLTFDDGYRDCRDFAYPILRRHGVPFTIFAASRFAEGEGDLWWVALERAIAAQDKLAVTIAGRDYRFMLADAMARQGAFDTLYWALRALPDEAEMRAIVAAMAADAGVPTDAICREFCMDWGELGELARDPLVTLGTHSDSHIMLAKGAEEDTWADIEQGANRMEAALGTRPAHFCYPIGDHSSAGPRDFRMVADIGFKTALTTRRGALYPEHRDHLTALPRISVNGNHQKLRYAETLLSGVPTALANGFSRVDVE